MECGNLTLFVKPFCFFSLFTVLWVSGNIKLVRFLYNFRIWLTKSLGVTFDCFVINFFLQQVLNCRAWYLCLQFLVWERILLMLKDQMAKRDLRWWLWFKLQRRPMREKRDQWRRKEKRETLCPHIVHS